MASYESSMICRVCRTAVNRFTDSDGTEVWVHAQTWETFDHDPDPLVAAPGAVDACCDFCAGPDLVRWMYETPREMHTRASNLDVDHGKTFGACDVCDQLIRRRDLDALVARCSSFPAYEEAVARIAAGQNREPDQQLRGEYRETQYRVLGGLMVALRDRRRVPPPPQPPAPISPAKMPKVRDRLAELWLSRFAETAQRAAAPDNVVRLPGVDVGHDEVFSAPLTSIPPGGAHWFAERQNTALLTGELLWVSKEMTLLAVTRGRRLPDLSIARHQLPSPSGLIVWEHPIMEVTTVGRAMPITAASWTLVPDGVWATFYAQSERIFAEQPGEQVRANLGYLYPVSTGDGAEFGTSVDAAQIKIRPSLSMWATWLATFLLMRQPRIVTVQDQVQSSRKAKRAAGRTGGTLPTVRIVDINRTPRARAEGSQPGTGGKWSVRVLVGADKGGFWRNQYYPSTGRHERIWVEEFWAGPQDGALRAGGKDVVHVLR